MSIRRRANPARFTVINNDVFKDNNLSFQAIGMLCYLLSKPNHWQVNVSHLIKVTDKTAKKTGRDGVYNILQELVGTGYVIREKQSSGELDYIVLDEPDTAKAEEASPDPDKPDPHKPDPHKTTLVNTDSKETTESEKNPIIPLVHSKLTIIPENLNRVAWQEWLNYKKEIKSPYKTQRGELTKANELIRLSSGDHDYQAYLVNLAIDNEWKGIYKPKGSSSGSPSNNRLESAAQKSDAALAEWLAQVPPDTGRTFEHGV